MWDLSAQDRLLAWRRFRTEISVMDFDSAVQRVNEFWWKAPFGNQFFSQDLPEDWPGPWELIYENYYDDIARALGMLYTIALSDHGNNHTLELICFRDRSKEHNLVSIDDDKYVLNMDLDVGVNKALVSKKARIICRHTAAELIK